MNTAPREDLTASALRQAIALACRRDESTCVAALAEEMQAGAPDRQAVADRARNLVAAVRRQRRQASGVDHLMHEFSLSSQEGVALMCLAESLLRIPDDATADRLIRDKISHGDWKAHLGHSDSLFVNAATWGLMITGKLTATSSDRALGNALTRLIAKGGEPVIRKGVEFAMQLLGQQFVMAETIEEALSRSRSREERGYGHSFDMLGEAALTTADAERYLAAYTGAIHAIGRESNRRGVYGGPGISVKLSALHPRYSRSQRARVLGELLPRLKSLAGLCREYDIGLNIDAEESERLEISLELLAALAADPELSGWDGLGFVAQAYQKRCPLVVDYLVHLARTSGRRLMVRLVKGAYWDSEIKRAQVEGQSGYPVYTRKVHSDLSYLVCAKRLLAAGDAVFPQFATHNAHTLSAVLQMAEDRGVVDYEFQCLHGMGEPLYDNVVGPAGLGRRCRIYAPVGSHQTLLPYLVRRLLENGANTSFVNRIVDEAVSIDELVMDPLEQVHREGGHPHPRIPLPRDLFGDRPNSAGLDLADDQTVTALDRELEALARQIWEAAPLVASPPPAGGPAPRLVMNPADRREQVGTVTEAGPAEVEAAIGAAAGFAPAWHAAPREERAQLLRRAADLLEARRTDLISLCIREAGKTWGNGVAEVREAADFCRYYAQELLRLPKDPAAAPGPVACISPWNFPLAIFTGQVAAALAAGSPVLAKPAEQTPLIAALAVRLFHRAGVPAAALQLLPGRGETVGAALTADPRVRGVIFTGSTEVARLINRNLAHRAQLGEELRLIAETGGQNAMVVDSSALPEQVVQDVLVSGFDSAGQRCSALRILCLQEDIADRVLTMLKEAMLELAVGNPRQLSTDIGPVIDAEARATLEAHIEGMRAKGRPVFQVALPEAAGAGHFLPPTLIEIEAVAELSREVFGPVVHVLRFDGRRLPEVIDAVNATGYGLTFGIHSRIDETIDLVVARIRAGNVYVNRNMVGAVVGVQPFGGEGLSGTGPKAGGPLYLHRLLGTAAPPPGTLGLSALAAANGSIRPLQVLADWGAARPGLAQACADYRSLSFLGRRYRLPGPTGESNTLGFAPRGRVLCAADSEADCLEQVAACLATGNRALLVTGEAARRRLAQLPPELADWVALADGPAGDSADAALFAGKGAEEARFRVALAAGNGPLVPVLVPGPEGRYPLHRLLAERVVTVNTTAAGGNTTLMTLGD